jgi:hypothetical protein
MAISNSVCYIRGIRRNSMAPLGVFPFDFASLSILCAALSGRKEDRTLKGFRLAPLAGEYRRQPSVCPSVCAS